MSAIAGMLRFDDRPVGRHELERAAGALRQHGPDRSAVATDGSVGFAHVLMRMTPEDALDRQPLRGPSGALIVADLRLDNRDDLIARAGLKEAANWPDSRILLAAWERFGDDVWPLLRGPFAAAIFNPRRRALTLARDHLGLNVVLWHRGVDFFAFATMPNGLFALGAPRTLSEEKFADFLVLNHAEQETTIYRGIFRVPPAHIVRVNGDGAVSEHRFWSAAEIAPVRLASDEAYAEGLRERLDLAVRRQMRSAHPLGCLLSGGLDSSSVAILAARSLGEKGGRLSAFAGVPRHGFGGPIPAGHYADPTPYVAAVAVAAGNIDVTYVHNDGCDDFAELEPFFMALEGPVRNPSNLGWVLGCLRQARAQGRRVLLGGLAGNQTISWSGWPQALAHLKRGHLLTAYRQWRLFYRNTPFSRWQALRELFFEPLRAGRLAGASLAWRQHSAIRPDFAAAMGVDARAQRLGRDFRGCPPGGERIAALIAVDYAGDWRAAEKAVTGVEVRDPTADVDVVSYCFGVPDEQYLAEGIDRSLIRRAMWGLLPETILANRLIGMQAADWHEKLERQRGELARQLDELARSALVRKAIDIPRLARALNDWPAGGWHRNEIFQEYNLALTRGIAGARFLRWFEAANSPASSRAA